MQNKRILFISHYAGFCGGIERYAATVASLLRREGFELCCAYLEKERYYDEFCASFDQVIKLEDFFASNEKFDIIGVHKLFDTPSLEKLLACYSKELILFAHDHDLYCPRSHYYLPIGRINCSRKYNVLACTICALASHPRHWSSKIWQFKQRMEIFKKFPKVITCSEFVKNNLIKNDFSAERITAILPPIAQGAFVARTIHTPVNLLFIGQFIRGKGGDYFIEMLSKLRGDFHANLVGDGKDRALLEKLVKKYNLESKVTFHGWLAEPSRAFKENDILILPQRWQEPLGIVGLEAEAAGMALVGFDVGGIGEYLIAQQTGILVQSRNVYLLAKEVDKLLAKPEQILSFERNCYDFVKDHATFELYYQKFSSVLSSSTSP